jgi:DNA-binding CsgD family transcriptional regulator
VANAANKRSLPPGRAAVERAVRDLVLGVIEGHSPTGVSVAVEGPPGIGKTVLARGVADSVAPGAAEILRLAGEAGQRNDPFAAAGPLLTGLAGPADPAEAAFDRVDELCGNGPVLLWADDAHNLDGATLTVLRRLIRASSSLPLAVLVTTRPYPSREPAALLVRQAGTRLRLPPMGPMMVERLVYDRTGRWPGPALRRALAPAAGNPLFVTELLRAHQDAGALAEAGPELIEARFELDLRTAGLPELIRAHLGQLDQPAREVLAAVAVWGTDITAGDLTRLAPVPARPADEPLEQALASGLVRRDPAGRVGFAHDLFREVTYDGLPAGQRRELHRRAATLAQAGRRPALAADHLLRGAAPGGGLALVSALNEAVTATHGYAPEVTSGLLDDLTALDASAVPGPLLLEHADALFRQGRGEAAETLVRARIGTVTDPAVAASLQAVLIRSLANRAEMTPFLEVIGQTLAIAGLPAAVSRQLTAIRAFLRVTAGQALPAVELDAMLARFTAAGDQNTRALVLVTMAVAAHLSGQPERALDLLRARDELPLQTGGVRNPMSTVYLPAAFALAASGPPAAQAQLDRARRLAAEHRVPWVDPFLGFAAGAIAFAAGEWDDAVAELDGALERAEETGTGWISIPVGIRACIEAHRGDTRGARARLESFRYRGLPLQFGHDRPGWAELAVLETEGAASRAAPLARTLWFAARDRSGYWTGELAVDVTRVAVAALDRRLAGQLADDAPQVCPPAVARLVHGMLASDPDAIGDAVTDLAAAGRHTLETFAREELACAAAAAGDRPRASAALDAALAGYQRFGALPDQDRALARTRALGLRRGPRAAHRPAGSGWAALTATEVRVAGLVREGLTNREIGTRLFVSPRTVQTHVSHILRKTGLRSRVEIARTAAGGLRPGSRPRDRGLLRYAVAAAAARPAIRPENRQPPRNVPSSDRYPCIPPPPNPAASPAAYRPGTGSPAADSTRDDRSVCSPPRVLRVSTRSRTAISGPAAGSSSACGLATRISRSPR